LTKKKNQKSAKPAQPAIDELAQLTPHPQPKPWPYVISGVFFCLSLIGILNHELWRDEFQAWMVAADAHSISQLFHNLKYEGNPVLWHAFLFIITALTDDPFFMQLFHILVSTALVFVINRHAPMSLLQKVLLTFSYFIFYEYNIISRSYGLGLLLVLSFCALYPTRSKQLWWMAAILFLLANCTVFGVILAGALAAYLALDTWFVSGKRKTNLIPNGKLFGFLAIACLGILLGYLQIRPEPNNSFPTVYVTGFDLLRLKEACSRIIYAYFPIPDVTDPHFWNTNLLIWNADAFFIPMAFLPVLLWIILFWKNKLITAMYVSVTLVLLAFCYYTGLQWNRYTGHLFVILLVCYWLFEIRQSNKSQATVSKLSVLADKFRAPIMTSMLVIGCVGGLISYVLDLQKPFSTSGEAAAYIKEQHLDSLLIVGTQDYAISPLATLLRKPIYYPESNVEGTFIVYDEKRIEVGGINDIIPLFTRLHQAGRKQVLLVKNNPVMLVWDDTGEREPWKDAMLTDQLNLRLLHHVEPGVVKNEEFYIYLVEEKLLQEIKITFGVVFTAPERHAT
jgi:hypothetical protein